MKRANLKTYTYEAGNGFMVDIVVKEDMFEAWIYHENYGVKDMMWGSPKTYTRFGETHEETLKSFKALVEANIPEHAMFYAEQYMDEDITIDDCDCDHCNGCC